METILHVKSGKFVAIIALSLVIGAFWWGVGNHAEASEAVGSSDPETCFVQDKAESTGLDMKLLVHRPGWVMPVTTSDVNL